MINLDYGTLLSPEPIKLSIGTIRQPTMRDIGKVTFPQFNIYQLFLKLTPKEFYTKLKLPDGVEYWDSLSDEERAYMQLYDIVTTEEAVQKTFVDIFNFFFVERVVYQNGTFFLLNTTDKVTADSDIQLTPDILRGVIHEKTFPEVLDLLQQVCCIKNEEIDDSNAVFKNEKAKKLWERMKKAKLTSQENAKGNINLTLPNIISSVAAKSQNLNIVSVWDITLFQLYDQFSRLQNNDAHSINSMRVATWGDEKKKFDYSLWYKNMFDRKTSLL